METIGDRLRETRTLTPGLSARELGELAGIAETYPSLIESGARRLVGSDVVARLASVLGVSTDFLILGTGPRPVAKHVVRCVSAAREVHRSKKAG